jgi:hypothetical protein
VRRDNIELVKESFIVLLLRGNGRAMGE